MKITNELAELTGIMYGDGCLSTSGSKYLIYISGHKSDDLEYHKNITKNLFLKVFNKEVKIEFRKKENTLFIRFSNKTIFNFFSELEMPIGKKHNKLKLPVQIKNSDTLILSFIRGLADTDGSIIFSKQHRKKHYYPRIEITNKSEKFLIEILSFLKKKGFYGSVSNKGNGYRLEIPGFENLYRWLELINFSNFKHLSKIEAQMGP